MNIFVIAIGIVFSALGVAFIAWLVTGLYRTGKNMSTAMKLQEEPTQECQWHADYSPGCPHCRVAK
jgi:hypothetical protein